jgi:hypothetical protein
MPNSLPSRHLNAATGRGLVDLADRRLYRSVEQSHELGPRVVCDLLAELGASTLSRTEIDGNVARYVTAFCAPEARR